MSKRLKTLIAGCGRMGLRYAKYIENHPKSKLIGIIGNSEKGLLQARNHFKGIKIIGGGFDNKSLKKFSDIDAVIIATPEWEHEKNTVLAIKNGLKVLLEKPVTDNISAAKNIFDFSIKYNSFVMPCHTVRFDGRVIVAEKKVYQEKAIGKIRRIYSRRNADKQAYKRILGNTNPVYWLLPHDIDLINFLIKSDVKSLIAREIKDKNKNIMGIVCDLKYLNEVDATIECTWITPPISLSSKTSFIDLFGDSGSLEINFYNSGLTVFGAENAVRADDPTYNPNIFSISSGADFSLIDHFIKTSLGLAEPVCTIADGVYSIKICSAIEKSIKLQKEIILN